jgi:hypothetical protein
MTSQQLQKKNKETKKKEKEKSNKSLRYQNKIITILHYE